MARNRPLDAYAAGPPGNECDVVAQGRRLECRAVSLVRSRSAACLPAARQADEVSSRSEAKARNAQVLVQAGRTKLAPAFGPRPCFPPYLLISRQHSSDELFERATNRQEILTAAAASLDAYRPEGLTYGADGLPSWRKDGGGRPPLRIGIYFDVGTWGSPTRHTIFTLVGKTLGAENVPFVLKGMCARDVRSCLTRENYDVVIFPGGRGPTQADTIGTDGLKAVKDFVSVGGGYIGVCGGASLAIKHLKFYGDVPVELPWDRGRGDVDVEFTDEGLSNFRLDPDRRCRSVFYGQGPIIANKLVPHGVQTLAKFRTKIHSRYTAETKGKMVDTAAILSCPYGRGRVITNSVHPESMTPPMGDIYLGFLYWVAHGYFDG